MEGKKMQTQSRPGLLGWIKSGEPMIWLNGAAGAGRKAAAVRR